MSTNAPNPPESPEIAGEWLSTSEAAAALGVSEKTVWRRAKSGELVARKVASGRGGLVWEIALQSDRTSDRPTGQSDTRPDKISRGSNAAPIRVTKPTGQASGQNRPTGQADTQQTDGAALVEILRETLEKEREQNAFLRGVIEQLQRDGAETRAALRAALQSQTKALPAHFDTSRENAPISRQNGEADKESGQGMETRQKPEKRRETAPETRAFDWNAVYRKLADELEGI